jgi:hypothetical protein
LFTATPPPRPPPTYGYRPFFTQNCYVLRYEIIMIESYDSERWRSLKIKQKNIMFAILKTTL